MKPYSINLAGGYLNSFEKYGLPYGTPTFTLLSKKMYSLSCPTENNGNYRDATPFHFQKISDCYLEGSFRTYDGVWIYSKTGDGCGGGPLRASVVNTASALDPYNKCLGKLYDQIRAGVDLSIDTYQGMQTVKMIKSFSKVIAHPLQTLASTCTSMLKDRKFVRSLKFSGSKWLEWQYGLRPSIDTIYNLTDGLVGAVSSEDGCLTAIAKSSCKAQSSYKGATCAPASGLLTKFECNQSRRTLLSIRCRISDPSINALSQFTSLNPASFFYENVPFSFVLDWVYDVGGYLRSMETALATGLEFASGYRTDTLITDVKAVCDDSDYDSYGRRRVPNLRGQSSIKTLNRSIITSMPLPVKPAISVSLGSARLLSTASLLTNLLKSNLPRR